MNKIQGILDDIGNKYRHINQVIAAQNKKMIYVFDDEANFISEHKSFRECEKIWGWKRMRESLQKNCICRGYYFSYNKKFEPSSVVVKKLSLIQPTTVEIDFIDGSSKKFCSLRDADKGFGLYDGFFSQFKRGRQKKLPDGVKQIIFH